MSRFDSYYRYKYLKYRSKYWALVHLQAAAKVAGLLEDAGVLNIDKVVGVLPEPMPKVAKDLYQLLKDHPELREEVIRRTVPYCVPNRLVFCGEVASDVAVVVTTGVGIGKLLRDLINNPEDTYRYFAEVIVPIVIEQADQGKVMYEENLNLFLEPVFDLDCRDFSELSFEEFQELFKERVLGREVADIIPNI
jgi:hypothetical protein